MMSRGWRTLVGHEKLKFVAAVVVALFLKEEFTSVDCSIALLSTENSLLRRRRSSQEWQQERRQRGAETWQRWSWVKEPPG